MTPYLKNTKGYKIINAWLKSQGYKAFAFQEETWQHIIDNKSGLVNAPTGTGKTFSVFLGALIQFINEHPGNFKTKSKNGLQLNCITLLTKSAGSVWEIREYDLI